MSIFTEIENILNNPPLKNVRDDFDNLEALTPINFLLGKYKNTEISGNDKNIYIGKSWKQVQAITKQFWWVIADPGQTKKMAEQMGKCKTWDISSAQIKRFTSK